MEMYKNIHLNPCYFVIQPRQVILYPCLPEAFLSELCLALTCFGPVSSYANNHHCSYCPGMPYWFSSSVLPACAFTPSTVTQGWSFTTGICSPISFWISFK